MIHDTIAELETRIERAGAVKPESKAELLALLATLRKEIAALSETHGEDAESIAAFTTVSTHEAIREKKNPELMKLSRDGLSSSVAEFEESHPGLVQIVNRICETLANLGI
jgi:predicted transcriptional regulator